jgi:hypothetical protein
MSAVATRPRVAKAKPAPVTSPVADILSRIGTAHDAIRMSLCATDEGSDLWTMLFGIDDNLMPYSLESLYRTSVSKEDVGEAYEKLLFTLTVLKAALMMSKGLVMEAKLQEAFEILDRAHSDMDSALVQHWPIPDGTNQSDETAPTVSAVEEDPARITIACAATYEADAILRVLRKTLPDIETFLDVFNGMSLRLLELNSVAMSVLGDDSGRLTEEMRTTVHGADA